MFRSDLRDLILLTAAAALIVLAAAVSIAAGWYIYNHVPRPSLAEKTRAAALATAKKQGKLVLLVFGIQNTSWSDRLDEYHADPDVRRVLEKYFVLARVDIEEDGGTEMYMERGVRGSPAFSILNSQGKLISDSGQDNQNVGFPNNPDEVDRYIASLKAACPELTQADETVLRTKLEQMRVAD